MKFLGMNLNLSARQAHGFPTVLPYYILVGLVVLTGWYQVRQTQARQLQSGNAAPNAQMQAMTKVFPVIFGLITLGINAGATLYFVVSNAWRIGQQHLVIGKMYDQAIAAGDLKPSAKEPTPKPADDDAGGNARSGGKPNSSKTPPNKKPPATRQPNAKGQSGGSNNGAGAQGMTPGARRKKKRKR
jgi:membrane protein insertase Oxa1/YidC/SpoIIIJ